MERASRTYIWTVVGAGALLLACALARPSAPDPLSWAIFTALVALASAINLRLRGMEGTFSPSFMLLLYGVANLSLNETLVAGCAGAVVQYLAGSRTRPRPIQALFNAANVILSVGACFLVGRVWLSAGMARHLPGVIAAVACVYFVVNTVLVSGILSLLQHKPLGRICSRWYLWSFPWYLVGVVVVALIPAPGQVVSSEAWLLLVPVVYLVHFFLRLARGAARSAARADRPADPAQAALPRAAHRYLVAVISAAVVPLTLAVAGWQSQVPARFVAYLALGVAASTFKIRLPGVNGTLSPAFVLLLAAIAQLSFAETVVMAALVGVVQVLWRAARPPLLAQILFNPACLAVGAALAWIVSRVALDPWLGQSLASTMLTATLVLYLSNTVIVALMMALLEARSLSRVWQLCRFWSLPYYLVGAAAAGIMTATSRAAGWPPSLLVLPLIGLVFVSWREQLGQAFARAAQVPA